MKALKRTDIIIAAVILATVMPAVHYFIKFNEKGYVEQKLLERYMEQKEREDIIFQTGSRTKLIDIDVAFKNIKKEDVAKIKAGDKELLPDKSIAAEILWVGEPKPNYFLVDIGLPNKTTLSRTNPEDGLFSVPAKIRLKGVVSTTKSGALTVGNFAYKDANVKDLEIFRFNCGEYEAFFAIEVKE